MKKNRLADIAIVAEKAFPEAFAEHPHPEIMRANCRDVVYLVPPKAPTLMVERPTKIAIDWSVRKQCRLCLWVSKDLDVDCWLGYAPEINVVFYYI